MFGRLLGLCATCAFVSWWVQMDGLVGSAGLVPASEQLRAASQRLGDQAAWALPTLGWLSASDSALRILAGAGMLAALMLLVGVMPRIAIVGVWVFYLSLLNLGGPFGNFQWDALLLETAVMSAYALPLVRLDTPDPRREPVPLGRWLVYALLFKLMFASGWVKLASDDPTWHDLTALSYHYETQPLPNALSYHAHWLPASIQRFSCAVMFAIELGAPWLVLVPIARARRVAFALLGGFQLLILLTGNYGFFNLLSIALCVPLLDDALMVRLIPARWRARFAIEPPDDKRPSAAERRRRRGALGLATAVCSAALFLWSLVVPGAFVLRYWLLVAAFIGGTVTFVDFRGKRRRKKPRVRRAFLRALATLVAAGVLVLSANAFLGGLSRDFGQTTREVAPELRGLRSFNRYGLFAVMTTERWEIIVEGSQDGESWTPYAFPYKPGALEIAPRWVPLGHLPRLDWQMWFAALGGYRENPWLLRLMRELGAGNEHVLGLLSDNPFPDAPPRFVRALIYRYHFTAPDERERSGDSWRREDERVYAPTFGR